VLADAPDDTTLSAGSRTTVDGQCVPTDAPTSHAELSTHSVPRCGRRPSATTPAVAAGPSAATSAADPAAGSACCDTAAAASCCDASAKDSCCGDTTAGLPSTCGCS
jgi:hypothetical protein